MLLLRFILNGGLAYSEIKQELYERLNEFFGERKDTCHHLLDNKDLVDGVLYQGAQKARALALPVLASVRQAVGISR